MIRLRHLLNEVKENRIYLAGLGILIEKVCEFLPDQKKVDLLAQLCVIKEAAEQINNTPYGLFTTTEVNTRITFLSMHLMKLQNTLVELLPEHASKEKELSALKCAIRAVTEVYDY